MQKPNFLVNTIQEKDNYGQFAIEPLENGFGHTLGNALRRVLLGSFRGAAITSVKVTGVTHKFSTLEGMSEDMIDLMLNLKNVKVGYDGDSPVTAKLSKRGGVVKASDIVTPPGVTIINPDLVIAKLAASAKLDMEIEIATGYGYSPADERSSDTLGVISLDAIFSPVERVSYHVDATRVGRRTDYDKIVMDIYTDGTQSPSQVIKKAAETLVEYFSQIVNPTVAEVDEGSEASDAKVVTIEELTLPTRISNALKNGGYKTAAELADATDRDLKNVKNLGGKSLDIIDEALQAKGFTRTK